MATYSDTIGLVGGNCGSGDYPADSSPRTVEFGDVVNVTVSSLTSRVGGIGYVDAASGGVYTSAAANNYSDFGFVSRTFTFTAPSTAATYHIYFFGQSPPSDANCWKNRKTIVVAPPPQAPTPPTYISIAADPNQQESIVPCRVQAFGGDGEAVQVSIDNVNWQPSGYTFPETATKYTRGTFYTFYARSYNASSGLSSSSISSSLALPYLDNQDLTINTAHTASVSSDVSSGSISFSSGNVNTAYSLVRSTDNVWTSADTLGGNDLAFSLVDGPSATYNLTGSGFPPAGSTYYYRFRARLRKIYGGSGADSAYEWCTLNGSGTTISISRADIPSDDEPDQFELGGPVPNAAFNTPYYSNTITVAGLSSGVTTYVQVSGTGAPQYSKNGGAYSNVNGVVENGDTITVEVTSQNTSGADSTATLDIGGITDTFTVTTSAAASGGETIIPGVSDSIDYGLKVYSAGQGVVLSPANRHINVVNSGTVPLPANGTTPPIDFEGMTLTNTSDALVYFPGSIYSALLISVNRGNGSFTITNNTSSSGSVGFVALRIG